MGFSFLKSFNLNQFLRLNLSKSGVSISVGPKGARLNYNIIGTNQGRVMVNAQKSVFGVPLRYRKVISSRTYDFKWSNKYGVYNSQMNQEHKIIISQINQLKDNNDLEGILHDLYENTRMHFENEELLMSHYDVPNYTEHKKAHDTLLMQYHKIDPNNSYEILSAWWNEHLLTLDKSYAIYIKKTKP